ncbi:hypothetical protein AX14_012317 [Amanita brunnescens Koide BX004]|nr:hypothetical protein AX14_012317 [Amanita brunnescens Koide BX004]
MRVREYAAELKLISQTIGSIPDRELTSKLWKGLSIALQHSLWRDSLDRWDEIVHTAERHEIANSLRIGGGEFSRATPMMKPWSNLFPWAVSVSRETDSNPSGPRTLAHAPRKPDLAPGNLSQPSGFRVAQAVGACLTERQRAEHAASGKCFGCGETGHLYRNCPQLNSVTGSSNRPPGRSNFNIEVDAPDVEDPHHADVAIEDELDSAGVSPEVEIEYDDEFHGNDPSAGDEYYDEPGAVKEEEPDDALDLAAICLRYDPGAETDSENNSSEDLNNSEQNRASTDDSGESAARQNAPPSESGPSSPELMPTRPNTPHHFFYEPNPLPNIIRMHDDNTSYHVSDWSSSSFSHVGDSGIRVL